MYKLLLTQTTVLIFRPHRQQRYNCMTRQSDLDKQDNVDLYCAVVKNTSTVAGQYEVIINSWSTNYLPCYIRGVSDNNYCHLQVDTAFPSCGMVKGVLAFEPSNNKLWLWMWTVAAYQRTHIPSHWSYFEAVRSSGAQSVFIKRTGWLMQKPCHYSIISIITHVSEGNPLLSPIYMIQPFVKPVVKLVWQPAVSCIQPVVKPVVQPGLTTGWTNSGCSFNTVVKPEPAVSCKQTSNRLSNLFDNRLGVCLLDIASC